MPSQVLRVQKSAIAIRSGTLDGAVLFQSVATPMLIPVARAVKDLVAAMMLARMAMDDCWLSLALGAGLSVDTVVVARQDAVQGGPCRGELVS